MPKKPHHRRSQRDAALPHEATRLLNSYFARTSLHIQNAQDTTHDALRRGGESPREKRGKPALTPMGKLAWKLEQELKRKAGAYGEGATGEGDKQERFPPKIEVTDRDDREAYAYYQQNPAFSAYRGILGVHPQLAAGDTAGATIYLTKIDQAIEQGGWKRSEWRRLHLMRRKWAARADGSDLRFMVAGNRQGGLSNEEKERMRMLEMGRGASQLGATGIGMRREDGLDGNSEE